MTKFSVIIATHHRPDLLRRALKSIQQQTYTSHQIIVVTDVADIATCQVATEMMRDGDIFVMRNGNPGPAESRNLALRHATGDYVVFLDDDDSFRPEFLEQISKAIPATTTNDILYTNFEVINEDGAGGAIVDTSSIDISQFPNWWVYVKNFIPNNCVIYPKNILDGITFDPDVAYEDWDFLLAVMQRGNLRHLALTGPCIHKNIAAGAKNRGSGNESKLLECYMTIYSKYPPKNTEVSLQRKALFDSVGIDINAFICNSPHTT